MPMQAVHDEHLKQTVQLREGIVVIVDTFYHSHLFQGVYCFFKHMITGREHKTQC